MPHIILTPSHAGALFRYFRTNRGLSRRELAPKLFVSPKTVANRELGYNDMYTRDLLHYAGIFDYDVVLQKRRHPGARPTGTGWPT